MPLNIQWNMDPNFSSTLLELMLDTLTVTRKSPNLIHFYCQVTKEFSTTNEMIPDPLSR